MGNLDITMVKLSHLGWKSKLADFMYGLIDLQESDIGNHHECDLGKWLYGEGLKEFAHLDIIHRIEKEHKEVHQRLKAIVSLPKEELESETGQMMINDFIEKCEDMLNLLDNLKSTSP